MRTRFKRDDLAFRFEDIGTKMLLRHPRVGVRQSDVYMDLEF